MGHRTPYIHSSAQVGKDSDFDTPAQRGQKQWDYYQGEYRPKANESPRTPYIQSAVELNEEINAPIEKRWQEWSLAHLESYNMEVLPERDNLVFLEEPTIDGVEMGNVTDTVTTITADVKTTAPTGNTTVLDESKEAAEAAITAANAGDTFDPASGTWSNVTTTLNGTSTTTSNTTATGSTAGVSTNGT